MLFKEILKTLPSIEHLQRLELYENTLPQPIAVIENKPGQQGSLAVYYHVALESGGITPTSAKKALSLYAEHTTDAQNNPGKHPNIDRLLDVIARERYLSVKAIQKSSTP